ncbi:hypothetical protein Gotur_035630 [Gossypium turneri]
MTIDKRVEVLKNSSLDCNNPFFSGSGNGCFGTLFSDDRVSKYYLILFTSLL